VVLDAYTEPLGQVVDRALERGIIERHELPALLADEVVVMLPARLGALEPRQALADRHALDESVVDEQLEHAVNARATRRLAPSTERVLDLDGAQSARLTGQKVDDPFARSAAFEACAR
jgi:hypothetical protein